MTERGRRGTDHDPFIEMDAAYVLGALPAAERLEFEQHLRECERCQAAVSSFAGMPGVLRSLPAVEAFALVDGPSRDDREGVSDDVLPALAARVRRRRRVRRWSAALVGAAAAATIAAAIVLPMTLDAPEPPTVSTSLQQVTSSPITADVTLTHESWGTRITMSCTYRDVASTAGHAPGYVTSGDYGLYVTDRSGATSVVSSWSAGPGDVVHTTGSVSVPVAQIATVSLRTLDTGGVLLSRSIAGPATSGNR